MRVTVQVELLEMRSFQISLSCVCVESEQYLKRLVAVACKFQHSADIARLMRKDGRLRFFEEISIVCAGEVVTWKIERSAAKS